MVLCRLGVSNPFHHPTTSTTLTFRVVLPVYGRRFTWKQVNSEQFVPGQDTYHSCHGQMNERIEPTTWTKRQRGSPESKE